MEDDLPQGNNVYIKLVVSESDDTINPQTEALQWSEDIESLTADVVDEIDEHGGIAYVYECRPVRKIVRGKTRVIQLKLKAKL